VNVIHTARGRTGGKSVQSIARLYEQEPTYRKKAFLFLKEDSTVSEDRLDADLKNLNRRGQGGPTYAAEFLRHFAGDGPWAHIDMAGTGFFTYSRGDYLWQRGGTGYGVRLIAELARRFAA
jgi:leucyl aminopeptidase